jgi:hypothetical protein
MTDDTRPEPADPLEARALDALRAADPAPADDPAALAAIRAEAMARIALETPAAADSPRTASASRRRWTWPRVAAAASVAAIGVGVVGLAVGRATAPAPPAALAANPAVPALAAGAPQAQLAGTEAALGADAAKSAMIGGWPAGAVVDPGPALPDEAGTASGYRFEAPDADPAGLAAAVARAFGVAGDVREQDGMWVVGSADWTGPVVTVSRYGSTVSWSYSDPTAAPCAIAEPAVADSASASASGASAGSAPDAACPPADGPVPSAAEAEARARALLADLGLDADGLRWEATADSYAASASGTLVVEGQPTPVASWFGFGPGGVVQNASGTLARVVAIPGYPVLGARSAVLRAQEPGWGALLAPQGGVMPLAAEGARGADGADTSTASAAAAPPVAPAPEIDGRPVAQLPIARVVAESAQPALIAWYQPDGSTLMLPGYALTADDGSTWTVIAVAEPYVAPLGG